VCTSRVRRPPTSTPFPYTRSSDLTPVPEPPFWGVREVPVDLDAVFPHLDLHVLFKLHWGGRGVKGEEWEALLPQCSLNSTWRSRSEEHTSELQSRRDLVCRLLLEK